MANSYKKRRDKMMAEDPHCHWCGIEVIYYQLAEGEKMPSNFATIDHIYSKFQWEARVEMAKKADPSRLVLACNGCNKRRNKEEQKKYNQMYPNAYRIRSKLGQERKNNLSTQPRPQVFRNLENIDLMGKEVTE